jgi:hypothetical protein
MSQRPLTPLAPSAPAAPAAGIRAGDPAADPAAFRRILERLEQLARPAPAPEVKDPADLADAMRKAEDGFTSAMDLRRQLEAAFRARTE